MHTAATKKKQRKDQIERNEEIDGLNARVASLEPEKKGDVKTEAKSAKKGKRVKAEADSDEEETKPVKKKRAGKVKKEEEDDQEEVATKPAKKSRAKKAVKNEDDEVRKHPYSYCYYSSWTMAISREVLGELQKLTIPLDNYIVSDSPKLFHIFANYLLDGRIGWLAYSNRIYDRCTTQGTTQRKRTPRYW